MREDEKSRCKILCSLFFSVRFVVRSGGGSIAVYRILTVFIQVKVAVRYINKYNPPLESQPTSDRSVHLACTVSARRTAIRASDPEGSHIASWGY